MSLDSKVEKKNSVRDSLNPPYVLDGGETHHDRKILFQRHGFDLALDEFDFGMRIIDAAIETLHYHCARKRLFERAASLFIRELFHPA